MLPLYVGRLPFYSGESLSEDTAASSSSPTTPTTTAATSASNAKKLGARKLLSVQAEGINGLIALLCGHAGSLSKEEVSRMQACTAPLLQRNHLLEEDEDDEGEAREVDGEGECPHKTCLNKGTEASSTPIPEHSTAASTTDEYDDTPLLSVVAIVRRGLGNLENLSDPAMLRSLSDPLLLTALFSILQHGTVLLKCCGYHICAAIFPLLEVQLVETHALALLLEQCSGGRGDGYCSFVDFLLCSIGHASNVWSRVSSTATTENSRSRDAAEAEYGIAMAQLALLRALAIVKPNKLSTNKDINASGSGSGSGSDSDGESAGGERNSNGSGGSGGSYVAAPSWSAEVAESINIHLLSAQVLLFELKKCAENEFSMSASAPPPSIHSSSTNKHQLDVLYAILSLFGGDFPVLYAGALGIYVDENSNVRESCLVLGYTAVPAYDANAKSDKEKEAAAVWK